MEKSVTLKYAKFEQNINKIGDKFLSAMQFNAKKSLRNLIVSLETMYA